MRKPLLALIGVGALLLAVSQFLPLFHTHIDTTSATLGSGSVGSAHAYGVLPLAVLAAILGWAVIASGSRFALLLVGILGAVALVIALGHDLSEARDHGLRVLGVNSYAEEHNVVAIGLYVEIIGALALLMATVLGLLLAGSELDAIARARPPRPTAATKPPRRPRAGKGGSSGPRRRARSETIGRRYDEDE